MPTDTTSSTPFRLLISMGVLAALWACSESPPQPPLTLSAEPVGRFLEQPPSRLLDLDDLYTLQETTSFSWRRSQEKSNWTMQPLAPEATGLQFPILSPEGIEIVEPMRLNRAVQLDAQSTYQVEVEVDPDLGPANLRLLWRRDDEDTLPPRRHLSALASGGRNQTQRYIFHVSRAPAWRGTIVELSLEVRFSGQQRPRLQRLVALGRELDSSKMAAVAGRGVLVELDHEVREAYLAPPGSAVVRRLDITEGDRLRFAYGTEASMRDEVRFRVVVEDPSTPASTGTADDTQSELAWESTVGLEGRPWGAWHLAEVDLSPWQGRARHLRLEVDAANASGHSAFSLWAHPEVIRPALAAQTTAEAATDDPTYNLLLISLDTVRADRLSLYGHDKPTSPNLDAWAEQHGVIFEQAVASAPWTLPSHMTLFSGLDALRHGVNHDVGGSQNGPGRGFELLAETLRRHGYATGATTGGAYMHPRYGFSHGFRSYRYWNDRARDDGELADGIDRTLEFLEEDHGQPFFFFFHTYAAHDPYEARQPYFDRVAAPGVEPVEGEIALHSPGNEPHLAFEQQIRFELRQQGQKRTLDASDRPLLEAFYDSNLARVDAELARLFEGLERLGRLDDTVVVITSDHGENLFDQGNRVGHLDLYDSNLLVPLIIAWPDALGAGRRIHRQVRAVDVLPTVLDGLGLPRLDDLDGVSLLPLLHSEDGSTADDSPPDAWSYSASANRGLALRQQAHKLIVDNNAWRPQRLESGNILGEGHELYALGEDTAEAADLWTANAAPSEVADVLRQRLGNYWREAGRGLRLTLHHDGPGTVQGTLEGPMIRPVGTKSLDLDCHCLTWQGMGQAAFELDSGTHFTLQFEKVFGDQLEISGVLVDGQQRHRFHHTFDAADLPQNGELRWDGRRWRAEDAVALDVDGTDATAGTGGTFFRLHWQGKRSRADDSPSLSDPELRRQLEALGYL